MLLCVRVLFAFAKCNVYVVVCLCVYTHFDNFVSDDPIQLGALIYRAQNPAIYAPPPNNTRASLTQITPNTYCKTAAQTNNTAGLSMRFVIVCEKPNQAAQKPAPPLRQMRMASSSANWKKHYKNAFTDTADKQTHRTSTH